jgi:ATP-dependent Clp protease ATP-binding subunit ClpA
MNEELEMSFDSSMFSDPTFRLLRHKSCTTKVIDVVMRVLRRASNGTLLLNYPFTESLTLLTLLRSEINVAQATLKEMQVDLAGLEKRLNGLLDQCDRVVSCSQKQGDEALAHSYEEASATIWDLIERGKGEAASLKHEYIGTEHLLLAIIRRPNASLASILAHFGVTYLVAKDAVLKILYA